MSRLVDPDRLDVPDPALRPRDFSEYVGQKRIVENLRVYVRAALQTAAARITGVLLYM